MNYYNEFDPFAAEWLRELIKDGLIPDGTVDDRSIAEVDPKDLKEFTQCHFFAGVAGWSFALELAGWRADRSVWTGSPPCQPFSTAGRQSGKDDERHLWPVFFDLVRECRPPVIFGEQVANAITKFQWFDDLQDDLEREGYASSMVVLPACSVGAPHKRDRLFYVARLADSDDNRQSTSERSGETPEARNDSIGSGESIPMADTSNAGLERGTELSAPLGSALREEGRESFSATNCESDISLAYADDGRQPGPRQLRRPGDPAKDADRKVDRAIHADSFGSFWEGSDNVYCRDGKYRQVPVEPEVFPLVNGVPNRVGILRGAGNAIVPQVGAEVIRAFMEYEKQ